MPNRIGRVRRANVTKMDTSSALAEGWARVSRKLGKGAFADELDVDVKTINRALTGETLPELHTALNSLLSDPMALNEVFKLYGLESPRRRDDHAANDLETLASISHLAGRWIDALADGNRDHRETCQLTDAIRSLLPALSALVAEADRIRTAA